MAPKLAEMGARELAEEDVVLLVAAIGAAVEQTLAPRLEIRIGRSCFPQARPKRGVAYRRRRWRSHAAPELQANHAPAEPSRPSSPRSRALPGIGPRLGALVEKLAGPLVVDLLWHLPFAGVIDRRNAPDVAAGARRERSPRSPSSSTSTWCRTVRASPTSVWCSDESGRICLTYFNGREDYLQEAAAARRDARGERQGRDLPGRGADDAPRPCRAPGSSATSDPAGRAGLWADGGPDAEAGAEGHCGRRRAGPRPARVAGRGLPRGSRAGSDWHGAHRPCPRTRRRKATCRRCIRRGRGWPSTNCWRASSRSRWCGITTGRSRDTRPEGDGRLRQAALASLGFELTASQKAAIAEIADRSGQGRAHDRACCRATSAAARRWWHCWPC
jgi:ATP-dependent DNA helicase RecG